ncbi:predicted protein [Chaetoceros tenuissimus]|uniref:Uncharacterized protein n=1 Tax=Chaetoceros tenuissimus TaxID=426638 RepID=A0AAD3H8J7_9STRA|nr:predicted protein [Chaetoceros tenuissimus]
MKMDDVVEKLKNAFEAKQNDFEEVKKQINKRTKQQKKFMAALQSKTNKLPKVTTPQPTPAQVTSLKNFNKIKGYVVDLTSAVKLNTANNTELLLQLIKYRYKIDKLCDEMVEYKLMNDDLRAGINWNFPNRVSKPNRILPENVDRTNLLKEVEVDPSVELTDDAGVATTEER